MGLPMRQGLWILRTVRIACMPFASLLVIAAGIGFADGLASASEASGGPRWERELVPITAPAAGASDLVTTATHDSTGSAKSTDASVNSPIKDSAARVSLGRFVLDSSLLAHTRDDFADLRLFDAGGEALGIHVQPVQGRERRCDETPVPMKRVSLQVLGDTAFEAVFLAEDPARLPNRIFISVEDKDFEISLSLWTAPNAPTGSLATRARPGFTGRTDRTSRDGWTPRLNNVPLFDYSRFVDLRREDARWPAGPDRAVRLHVVGLTQMQRSLVSTLSGQVGRPGEESFQMERKLLRVDAISFSGEVCADHPGGNMTDTLAFSSPGFAKPLREAGAKRSWFVFPVGRIPLKALLPQVGTRNFLRSVIVTGLTDSLIDPLDPSARPWTWPRIAEARLHRIDWGGQPDSSLRIPVPPGRFATLALGVADNDDAPLILKGMDAEADRLEALFPLRENSSEENANRDKQTAADRYLLRYGDPGAEPVHFDFESLLESHPQSVPAAFAGFKAGSPRALRQTQAVTAFRFPWLTGQLILTLGLALAIAGLMALVFLVARKAEKQA